MAVPLNHKNHPQLRSGKSARLSFTLNFESQGYKVVDDTFALSGDGKELIRANPESSGVLNIPNRVTSIGDRAFEDCNISVIVFPRSLQALSQEAFTSCNVTVIVFNSSPSIPKELFSYWKPQEIIVKDKNDIQRIIDSFRDNPCRVVHKADKWSYYRTLPSYSDYSKAYEDEYGVLYSEDRKILLRFNKRLRHYKIPEGVDTIAQGAFADCNIREIAFPKSMRVIGNAAFSGCKHLTTVSFNLGLKLIFDKAFDNCILLSEIFLPNSVSSIGSYRGCISLSRVKLPSYLTEIPTNAFKETALTEIVIPDSVETIGYCAFQSTKLFSITLPKSLKTLSGWGLSNCQNIQSITLPQGVDTIPCEFFADCKNLRSVTIQGNLKSIDRAAFKGCVNLEEIVIPNQEEIHYDTFQDCQSLTSLRIPQSVRHIRHGAFAGCTNLDSLELSEGLETIESGIISSTKLTEIVIPSTVQHVDAMAFCSAHYLSKVTFLGGLRDSRFNTFNDNVFEDCPALQEIHIPKGTMEFFKKHLKKLCSLLVES